MFEPTNMQGHPSRFFQKNILNRFIKGQTHFSNAYGEDEVKLKVE